MSMQAFTAELIERIERGIAIKKRRMDYNAFCKGVRLRSWETEKPMS